MDQAQAGAAGAAAQAKPRRAKPWWGDSRNSRGVGRGVCACTVDPAAGPG